MILKSCNCGRDDDNDEADDVFNKTSPNSSNNVRVINITNINNTDNKVQRDLLHDINAIQQDDFVCDNNQYYLNNNYCDPVGNQDNSNSTQTIIDTILEVMMNGMFYIPAKKKYTLYLLIPKKKRSFHSSKEIIDIPNDLDHTVPSQSQSLLNIYVIDIFCDHVHVRDNDTVPFTVQYTIQINSNEESCTVQYSKH